MSRKWERMVEKNRKNVNSTRKKQGLASIEQGKKNKATGEVIKGRSWMFPSLLIAFSVLYFTSFSYEGMERTGIYWFTGISYFILGIIMFFLRRPIIKIGRTSLTVRRFTGDKMIQADEIEELTLNKAHVVIQVKKQKKKIIYTRLQHLFPMDILNSKLRELAVHNKIPFRDET